MSGTAATRRMREAGRGRSPGGTCNLFPRTGSRPSGHDVHFEAMVPPYEKTLLERHEASSAAEPETKTADGNDPAAGFELSPQTVDMRIDGAAVVRQFSLPDSGHDLFA